MFSVALRGAVSLASIVSTSPVLKSHNSKSVEDRDNQEFIYHSWKQQVRGFVAEMFWSEGVPDVAL